jgi:hypothetical protein
MNSVSSTEHTAGTFATGYDRPRDGRDPFEQSPESFPQPRGGYLPSTVLLFVEWVALGLFALVWLRYVRSGPIR